MIFEPWFKERENRLPKNSAAETGQKALTLPAAGEDKQLVGDIHERLRIYRQEKLQDRPLQQQ